MRTYCSGVAKADPQCDCVLTWNVVPSPRSDHSWKHFHLRLWEKLTWVDLYPKVGQSWASQENTAFWGIRTNFQSNKPILENKKSRTWTPCSRTASKALQKLLPCRSQHNQKYFRDLSLRHVGHRLLFLHYSCRLPTIRRRPTYISNSEDLQNMWHSNFRPGAGWVPYVVQDVSRHRKSDQPVPLMERTDDLEWAVARSQLWSDRLAC